MDCGGGACSSQGKGARKRGAEDGLEGEQRLSKRFNLLKLDQPGKLWLSAAVPPQQSSPPLEQEVDSDYMHVEDTKDRVFIRDLDEELADAASDEQRLVFLPDIEKKFIKIPQSVLTGEREATPMGSELVLYSVPASLSVPEEQDSVRRAILEARARARESSHAQARMQERHARLDGHTEMNVDDRILRPRQQQLTDNSTELNWDGDDAMDVE